MSQNLRINRLNRQHRNRLKLKQIKATRPRLHVYRSNRYLYAQIIDDAVGKTMVAASSQELDNGKEHITKTEAARRIGELLAKKAQAKKIVDVKFDRGSYQFHGRVKALAQAAREKGLNF